MEASVVIVPETTDILIDVDKTVAYLQLIHQLLAGQD